MANPEHLRLIREGIFVWNNSKNTNPLEKRDLSGACLSGADLFRANLSETDTSVGLTSAVLTSGC